jgi:hypothetical protein
MEMLRNADENSDILQPHIFYKKLSSIFPGWEWITIWWFEHHDNYNFTNLPHE